MPPVPVTDDAIGSKSLDDINRDSPLKPLFYGLDQAEVDAAGQQVLQGNADVLKKYSSWQITVEGHCDERGTAEYNLALGERRAVAARNYLVSLGIARRSHQDGQLRQGVSVRRRAHGGGVGEEPARPLRRDGQVGHDS